MSGKIVGKFLGEISVPRLGKSNTIGVNFFGFEFGLNHCQGVHAQFTLRRSLQQHFSLTEDSNIQFYNTA